MSLLISTVLSPHGGYLTCGLAVLAFFKITQKVVGKILMKFSGNVNRDTRNKLFNFGGYPDHRLDPGIFMDLPSLNI